MHLTDLNWMDVESYLAQDDRILLVTGATEQHAYLSLHTDIKIPLALASAVAEREKVLVAPPLNFGCSQYFMEFPGTISLSEHTFGLALSDIVRSLIQHGFWGILILNGHGGNALPAELEELQREVAELRLFWYDWWRGETVRALEAELGVAADHANWLENFPFTRVAESPARAKPAPDLTRMEAGESARAVLGDGSFGGPYQMPDEVMDRFFTRLVDEVAAIVRVL